MINYSPFYMTLIKKKMSQYKLINKYLISSSTLNRIKNNEPVSLSTIDELCKILKCDIKDIVKIV